MGTSAAAPSIGSRAEHHVPSFRLLVLLRVKRNVEVLHTQIVEVLHPDSLTGVAAWTLRETDLKEIISIGIGVG